MTESSCTTCRFWKPLPIYAASGQCRSRPPQPVVVENDNDSSEHRSRVIARWPLTKSDDWCGEHEEREG